MTFNTCEETRESEFRSDWIPFVHFITVKRLRMCILHRLSRRGLFYQASHKKEIFLSITDYYKIVWIIFQLKTATKGHCDEQYWLDDAYIYSSTLFYTTLYIFYMYVNTLWFFGKWNYEFTTIRSMHELLTCDLRDNAFHRFDCPPFFLLLRAERVISWSVPEWLQMTIEMAKFDTIESE